MLLQIKKIDDVKETVESVDISSLASPASLAFLSQYYYDMKIFGDTRLPLAHTKSISEIKATGKKPFKQKHTGNARRGSMVAPHHVGGAVVNGPRAKRCIRKLNSKSTIKAKKAGFYFHFKNNNIFAFDTIMFQEKKTKLALSFLKSINALDKNVLIITGNSDFSSFLPFRNLPLVKIWRPDSVTVTQIFYADCIIFDRDAINKFFEIFSI